MPDPPSVDTSRDDESPPNDRPPWSVYATAAIAWLLAAFSFYVAAQRLDSWGDIAFFTWLGSWAAYLGMSLTRGSVFAWTACRWVTAGTVGVNLLIACGMMAVLAADAAGLRQPPFNVPPWKLLAYAGFVFVMTAGPLTVFRCLGRGKVRRWFGIEDEDGLPVGSLRASRAAGG